MSNNLENFRGGGGGGRGGGRGGGHYRGGGSGGHPGYSRNWARRPIHGAFGGVGYYYNPIVRGDWPYYYYPYYYDTYPYIGTYNTNDCVATNEASDCLPARPIKVGVDNTGDGIKDTWMCCARPY